MVYTCATSVALSYKYIPYTEAAYTNCLANSSDTYIGKTPVPDSGVLFAYPFINRRLYYSNSLSLNKSIDLTSIGL